MIVRKSSKLFEGFFEEKSAPLPTDGKDVAQHIFKMVITSSKYRN